MSTYTSKKILLPSGLDEIALERSLIRLPEEILESFKDRLLLEHRDPVDNSFGTFKKSPCRQVGELEVALIKITVTDNSLDKPRLVITSSKFYWYDDSDEEPTLELNIQSRDGAYFFGDIVTALNALGTVSVEILDGDYEYKFSRQLRVEDTDITDISFLRENYVNNLGNTLVKDLRFSNTNIFKTEKSLVADLVEEGDFYVDYENGVVFSFDLQAGYISYTHANFPLVVWWQPVRVFELNDPDISFLIKDDLITDDGPVPLLLNAIGTKYLNELSEVYPLEWGK